MGLRESQGLQDSREIQVLRVSQGHKERLDPQGRRVLMENQVCRECQDPMVPQVILEKKGLLEKKDIWVLLVHKVPLVTLGLVV